jgi:hypothetical protein
VTAQPEAGEAASNEDDPHGGDGDLPPARQSTDVSHRGKAGMHLGRRRACLVHLA